jgi:recombinational DNA repair protein RecR
MKENKHGGKRDGAGRKTKADELKFISKLDNIIDSDDAIKKLKQLIQDDNFNALKLYLEYRFGKPKEVIENINHNFNGELTEQEAEIIKKVVLNKY